MADEHAHNIAFVSEVEKHPELFNSNLAEYSRKDVVEKAWREVGQQMKMTAAQCKNRWKNLRSVFVRNLKFLPSSSGGPKKKPYYLMAAMNFALPFVKTKIPLSSGNVPLELQSQHEGDDQDNSEQEESSTTSKPQLSHMDLSTANLSQPASQQPHSSRKITKKLRPKRRFAKRDVNRLYVASKKAKLSVPQGEDKQNGAIKSFLVSLVPELEPMTEDQLRQFRRKVFVLIDSIYQSRPNYDYSSSSTSSLNSPTSSPPTDTDHQMEPSPTHQ